MADNNTRVIISAEDRASPILQRAASEFTNFGGAVTRAVGASSALGALAGGGALAGLTAIAASAIETGGKLNDMAMSTGASVEQLSALRNVAELSGVSLDDAGRGLQKLSKNMFEAATGNKDAAATFKALGVSIVDSNGALRDIGLVQQDVAKSIAALVSPTERVAAAQLAMGKTGANLVPMLIDMANGAEMVATWTSKDAALADELGDNLVKLRQHARGAGEALAKDLLPALVDISSRLESAFKGGLVDGFVSRWGAAFKGLAAAMNEAMAASEEFAAKITFGKVSENHVKQALALRDAAKSLYAEMSKLATPEATAAPAKKDSGDSFTKRTNEVKAAKVAVDELAVALNKIYSKDTGVDASYWKDFQTLMAGYKSGRLDLDQYRDAVGKLTTSQKFHQDALKAAADEQKLWTDAAKKAADESERALESLDKRAAAAEIELETYGLTKSAIEDTIIARLEEKRAMEASIDSQDEVVAKLDAEITARKRARDAFRQLEVKEDAKKAADDATKAWEKFAGDIESALTDSLMRGFEAGQGFGEAFVKSLQNTLKTTVLKMAVQAVVDPIMGGVRSILGGGAAGGGSALGAFGSMGVNAGESLVSLGGFMGSETMKTFGAEMMMGEGVGGAVAGAMPWVAGALAIGSLLSSSGETRGGGRYGMGTTDIYGTSGTNAATYLQGPSGGQIQGIQDLTTQTYGGINTLLKNLGSSAYLTGFQTGAETSDKGRGGVFSGGILSTGARFGESGAGNNYSGGVYENTSSKNGDAAAIAKNFGQDMLQVTIQALQAATDIPQRVKDLLAGVDAETLTSEFAADLIGTITAIADLSKPLPDILDKARIAGLSAFGAWQNSGEELRTFAAATDGSLSSLNKIGTALQARYATELQLIQQIQSAMASASGMFGDSIRSVELSVLDAAGKYAYFDKEAARFKDTLSTLTDPELIQQYAAKLNSSIMSGYGVLNADQQKAVSPDFIKRLEGANALTQERLLAAQTTILDDQKTMQTAIATAIETAMQKAAAAIATAAATPHNVNVNVDVTNNTVETVAYEGGG